MGTRELQHARPESSSSQEALLGEIAEEILTALIQVNVVLLATGGGIVKINAYIRPNANNKCPRKPTKQPVRERNAHRVTRLLHDLRNHIFLNLR
jgi:hypothetical protein